MLAGDEPACANRGIDGVSAKSGQHAGFGNRMRGAAGYLRLDCGHEEHPLSRRQADDGERSLSEQYVIRKRGDPANFRIVFQDRDRGRAKEDPCGVASAEHGIWFGDSDKSPQALGQVMT
jgi:hypothetical protein